MYQEFNQHKKADTVKWIVVFVLIFALMGGVIASILLATNQNKVGNTGSVIELDDGSLLVNESDSANDETYAMPKKLMFAAASTPTLAAKAGHTVSIKLTATVTPIEAENKAVDWSVAWVDAEANKDKNVADYVTVTPESDGSATATVVCKKAFDGSEIVITVTTREGGFTAQCKVIYVGKPNAISISATGATVKKDTAWNVDVAEVKSGQTYLFDINLDNDFGVIGKGFTPNYKVSGVSYGSLILNREIFNSSGESPGITQVESEIRVADLWDSDQHIYTFMQVESSYAFYNKFYIENGKLKVVAESVYSSTQGASYGRGGSVKTSFASYKDNKLPYVLVTVTEQNTGLTATICVRTTSGVQGVSLSSEVLYV